MLMSDLRTFDAFSGIGGFRIGLETADLPEKNIRFVAASDNDNLCRDVYLKSYETAGEIFIKDVEFIKTEENRNGTVLPDFDLFVAGFPCQPFANIGHRKGFQDERGTLISTICEMLRYYQPNYFILENVQKMRNLGKGSALKRVIGMLKASGYSVCVWDLCASNYGVPQQRRRLIFCGIKERHPEDIYLPLPEPIPPHHRKYETTWHLLEREMPKEHIVPPKTAETVFRRNENWQGDIDINRLIARPLTATMAKWHRANQDNYFTEDFVLAESLKSAAGCGSVPSDKLVRRFSLKEGLRLQGFEDDVYEVFQLFNIKPTAGFRLIGNSIPVPLVKVVAEHFFKSI
jgi:DNA (cytosine-5)-methyltransferase 1